VKPPSAPNCTSFEAETPTFGAQACTSFEAHIHLRHRRAGSPGVSLTVADRPVMLDGDPEQRWSWSDAGRNHPQETPKKSRAEIDGRKSAPSGGREANLSLEASRPRRDYKNNAMKEPKPC
jgi:hypothetical protein